MVKAAIPIGELVMPRLNVDFFVSDTAYASSIVRLVSEERVGGFCVFGGTALEVARAVKELRSVNDDLLFSCDCEFGLPMRLSEGGTEFPDAMAIAKTGDEGLARRVGEAIAKEMRALGLGWNFAPVADVNSNPKNPIINTRAFGETPDIVSKYAGAFLEGLQSEGVAGTAKHFPGHGDTSVDSHRELPIINRDWEEFQRMEIPPFQKLIEQNVASVMTGHVAAPPLSEHFHANDREKFYPATLSNVLTTSLLRHKLGFQGVIVTDSLEMHAITKNFGENEATIKAFEAGSDILLMPSNPSGAIRLLTEAVDSGRIFSEAISVRIDRIKSLKNKFYIHQHEIAPEKLEEWKNAHEVLANEIAFKALEVTGTIDISNSEWILLADERGLSEEKANLLSRLLFEKGIQAEIFKPDTWPNKDLNDRTILVIFHRARGYIGGIDSDRSIPTILRSIDSKAIRGLILFGSPYLDMELRPEPEFVIKTFSESRASVGAVHGRIFR